MCFGTTKPQAYPCILPLLSSIRCGADKVPTLVETVQSTGDMPQFIHTLIDIDIAAWGNSGVFLDRSNSVRTRQKGPLGRSVIANANMQALIIPSLDTQEFLFGL